jgi:hypothetical protein
VVKRAPPLPPVAAGVVSTTEGKSVAPVNVNGCCIFNIRTAQTRYPFKKSLSAPLALIDAIYTPCSVQEPMEKKQSNGFENRWIVPCCRPKKDTAVVGGDTKLEPLACVRVLERVAFVSMLRANLERKLNRCCALVGAIERNEQGARCIWAAMRFDLFRRSSTVQSTVFGIRSFTPPTFLEIKVNFTTTAENH